MLRASGDATNTSIDLDLIKDGSGSEPSTGAVPHADLLTRFVDAAVGEDGDLATVRAELVEATNEATMIDAAGVIAGFEMMTRVADGTGTAHPAARLAGATDVRDHLGLDDYEPARVYAD